jgi:hypothetical protein
VIRRACALLFISAAPSLAAQSPASFVGDWRLVSVMQPDSAGGSRPFWGPKPLGMIRYSANGVMTAQLYDERRPSLGANRWQDVTPALVRGYRFLPGNRIELRVITGPDGRPTTTGQLLVWERVPNS